MKAVSWTVFFMFKPITSIHTTLLTDSEGVSEKELIRFAKKKIFSETGIDVQKLADKLGVNNNFGNGWILVEMNDISATKEELEVLEIIKVTPK